MARVVRKAEDVRMYGFDNHGGLYYFNIFTGLGVPPGPPAPLPPGLSPIPPFSMHGVLTSSAWPGEHQTNETVFVDGAPIVSKGHEVKRDIHIPPGGNLLLPVTIIFASAKWLLGVGSVQATKGPVAATMLEEWGVTYNCQDPCSFFFPNVMFANATVQVKASGADYAESGVTMLIQSLIEFALALLFNHGQDAFKKLLGKYLRTWIPKLLGQVSQWVGEKVGKFLGQGILKKILDWTTKRMAAETVRRTTEKESAKLVKQLLEEELEKVAVEGGKKETGKDVAKKLGSGALEDAINPKKEAAKIAAEAGETAVETGKDLIHGVAEDQTKDTTTKLAEAASQTASEFVGKKIR